MERREIKKVLLANCNDHVKSRKSKIKQAIADIEESLLEESKNSSGDKHETGRAMLQIDRENAGKQLLEIEKLETILDRIDPEDYVRLGSIVETEKIVFYISISIGAVKIEGEEYICVALNSPIGMQLSGKKQGESFSFNNQLITVKGVF